MNDKPQLRLAVLSDYVCPFCYIGFLRLEKLRAHYQLAINWALVELHPETAAASASRDDWYSREQQDAMDENLEEMVTVEGIKLSAHTCITNSHKALLLGEAAKSLGAETFYRLHRRLFESYLVEGQDIADEQVLNTLAAECAVPAATVEQAWNDPALEARLKQNKVAAIQYGATRTPTMFIGEQVLTGAVSDEKLMAAARAAIAC